MTVSDLEQYLGSLDPKHLANLGHILHLPECDQREVGDICDAIRWRYHSRTREALRNGALQAGSRVRRLWRDGAVASSSLPPLPSYAELVEGLALKLDIDCDAGDLPYLEKAVIYTVITESLQRMTTRQRIDFFEKGIDVSAVLGDGVVDAGLSGPLTTVSALGIANAAGAGLYSAAATALGMVTHAVGVTLPFAVYSGLSSTIGFLLGPAGWLAAGGWLAWRLTGPDWKILTQVVVYLITERHDRCRHSN